MNVIEHLPYIKHAGKCNFFLIAGPCVVEDETSPLEIASVLAEITDRLEIPFIFKASYRKANRSSSSSFTGIGDQRALEVLARIKEMLKVPVLTDIHTEAEATLAARYVDVLQIPAFLCRQSDLLYAAGRTGKAVNIKKGQFAAPSTMKFAVDKVRETGNQLVMLTERGSMFGYGDLIVDYRNIPEMQKSEVPVILDATHSLQQPNQAGGITGGKPELITVIASAGIAAGVDGLFIETHPHPSSAKSDGANMLKLDKMEALLLRLIKIRQAIA